MSPRPWFFPDNTVLINVGILGYVDHLAAFVQGRGRWCGTVEHEWCDSRDYLDLASHDADLRTVCGTPLYPDHGDFVDIESLLAKLRSPGDPVTKHVGEAETLVIIRRRREFFGSIFITDDTDACRLAEAEQAVSRCLRTPDLLAYFEAMGRITRSEAHDALRQLAQQSRYVQPALAADYDALSDGLQARHRAARPTSGSSS